jgi:hypothetical protein
LNPAIATHPMSQVILERGALMANSPHLGHTALAGSM